MKCDPAAPELCSSPYKLVDHPRYWLGRWSNIGWSPNA